MRFTRRLYSLRSAWNKRAASAFAELCISYQTCCFKVDDLLH